MLLNINMEKINLAMAENMNKVKIIVDLILMDKKSIGHSRINHIVIQTSRYLTIKHIQLVSMAVFKTQTNLVSPGTAGAREGHQEGVTGLMTEHLTVPVANQLVNLIHP